MTPAQLADIVRAAGAAALVGLGLDPSLLPDAVGVERPRNPEHGDYASALALQVAGQAGVPPRLPPCTGRSPASRTGVDRVVHDGSFHRAVTLGRKDESRAAWGGGPGFTGSGLGRT
jgi:hypothetical protein